MTNPEARPPNPLWSALFGLLGAVIGFAVCIGLMHFVWWACFALTGKHVEQFFASPNSFVWVFLALIPVFALIGTYFGFRLSRKLLARRPIVLEEQTHPLD